MSLLNQLKTLLTPPTPAELAKRELQEAERDRLTALSTREYADGMVRYNEARVTRLRKYLEGERV